MKIVIDLDNPSEAVSQLRELANKLREFSHEVATEAANNIQYFTDKGAIKATVEPMGDGYSVHVRNDQVAFLEFGAGFPAQTITIEGLTTYPGAWSEDHEHEFEKWVASGKNPDDFPYNREPQMVMQNEAHRLYKDTERKAVQYFGE